MPRAHEILRRLEAATSDSIADSDELRHAVAAELDGLVEAISEQSTFEKAEGLMKMLGDTHLVLARLAFVHKWSLTDRQREIVRQYDRHDDEGVRREVYEQIQLRRFPWSTGD